MPVASGSTDPAMAAPSQCTALNLSDEKHCEETATSLNGLFCAFHSKQCQGLYRGYKRRNAHLDRLSMSPPQYLAENNVPLANQLFEDVDSEKLCQTIHDHLFLILQLLERVIRARKLHHSRFFSMNYDYGHAKFLDQLQSRKATVTKALERIERRTAEILYKSQKWFKWVRQCQDDEEAHREKEQKKVKQEAALFRRQWKEVQQRMKELREKEERKKQDTFLEMSYKDRMVQQELEEDGLDWDPIDDVLEDNRRSFIDMIKHFLWMAVPEDIAQKDTKEPKKDPEVPLNVEEPISREIITSVIENEEVCNEVDAAVKAMTSKGSKKKTGTSSENYTPPSPAPIPLISNVESNANDEKRIAISQKTKSSKSKKKNVQQVSKPDLPDKSLIETREEMHDRLKNGSDYNYDEVVGVMVSGTVQNPVIATKTPGYPEEESQRLLAEVSEIKQLLFCRLLLGHAALLPAALRANSVEDFFHDPEVTESALRDLCLKVEKPGLQEIRDACADLFRSEDDEDGDMNEDDKAEKENEDESDSDLSLRLLKPKKGKGALPKRWFSKREKAREKFGDVPDADEILGGKKGTVVDFGELKSDGNFRRKKVRVKICGRTIWNYPSDKAMNRGGWLHFCIIAKDSNLHDAIQLCRHWEEFFELNILAIWQYFPGTNWVSWAGSRYRQQMLELGFIMYMESVKPDAYAMTSRQQTGRRGPFRRSHAVLEARNFICAHIKRNDQVSRRLVQYLSMQSHRLLVLVRDAHNGNILIKPEEEELWIVREKSGLGRATKKEWNIIRSIGPHFFEEMDQHRKWNFGFKDYFDLYVWDLAAGEQFPALYNAVQEMVIKAHRCCTGADLYNPSGPILETLTKDKHTYRVRDIKSGEDGVMSIYDEIHHEETQFFYSEVKFDGSNEGNRDNLEMNKFPRRLFYNEADALEDEILFPEEQTSNGLYPSAVGKIEPLRIWEEEGFSMMKFVNGWDSDWDSEFDFDSECESDDTDEDEQATSEEGHEVDDEAADENDDEVSLSDESVTKASAIPEELKKLFAKLALDHEQTPQEPYTEDKIMEDFEEFLDREKARVFKKVWHKSDLEPHAQIRYIEMMEMAKKCQKFNKQELTNPALLVIFQIIDWLQSEPGTDSMDVHKAFAKMSPYFFSGFFDSEEGQPFKESLLFNQEERAKHVPDHRSHVSNMYRTEEFWKEWDDLKKGMKSADDTPLEWDSIIRPIIARLYKGGVIRTKDDCCAGKAVAAKELHRDTPDLFIDFRATIPTITMPRTLQDPHSLPPLQNTAQDFAAKHPRARFALLRLWSAPHFYPLMIGPENRAGTSFEDCIGRCFIWMFVPKDMPNSEWSIHNTARQRLLPYASQLGDRVVVKRNAFLVMGTDEKDLCRLAGATAYAIQRRPWRWEVDLWKSFINVDIAFLGGLHDYWLE